MSSMEFIEGPMWYFATAVFVVGALWRVIGIIALRRKPDLSRPRGSATAGFFTGNLRHFFPKVLFLSRTAVHVVGGYAFHLGLFILLLFAAPHVAFIKDHILGFGWPAMPRWAFIVAAQAAFAGLIVLWLRRVSDPVMKQISDRDDHIGSILTFLVMLTGCLALQESHAFLRGQHMLFVNLWLIYFPFSRLMHAFTFFLSRGFTGATYGRRGVTP